MKISSICILIIVFCTFIPSSQAVIKMTNNEVAEPFPTYAYQSTSPTNDNQKSNGNQGSGDNGPISENANFPDDYGKVEVKKYSIPNYNDYYLLNKTYSVYISIQGIGRPLSNLTIREQVDSNLEMNIKNKSIYAADPLNDNTMYYINKTNLNNITSLLTGRNDSYLFDNENNNLYIHVNSLKPKNILNYKYEVKSNKTGDYETRTVVRIVGADSKLNDIILPQIVKIRQPEFEENVLPATSYGFIGHNISISYHLFHKAGWSIEPFKLNATFGDLNSADDFDIYINGSLYKGIPIPIQFVPFKDTIINLSIKYKTSGSFDIPELFLESQLVPTEQNKISVYHFGIEKSVEDNQHLWPALAILLAFFTSLVSIYFSKKEISLKESEIRDKKGKNN